MKNRNQTGLKLAIKVGLLALLLGCTPKINQENYAKIQNGMMMAEVKAILGEPTEAKTASIGGLSGTNAVWTDSNGASISIKFLNGKVQLKTFVGE